MLTSLSRQRPCHTIYLRTKHFFFLFLPSYWGQYEEKQMDPASLTTMAFWFQFPISSLSQFDKVTSCHHLQYPTPFTQAPRNTIINMKYCPDMLWLVQQQSISVYCSEIKPLPQVPMTTCLPWGKKSPTGITNPLLVCTVATIQQNKIIIAAQIWTPRWNDKCQEIFILLNKLLLHSSRLCLF